MWGENAVVGGNSDSEGGRARGNENKIVRRRKGYVRNEVVERRGKGQRGGVVGRRKGWESQGGMRGRQGMGTSEGEDEE